MQAANSQNITVSVWVLSESKMNGLWTERKETFVLVCLFVCFTLQRNQSQSIWALSIQQKFRFETSEISSAQWNGTFRLHTPDPSHHVFGYCPCKQDTTTLSNGKGHFGPTDRNDQTSQSGPPSKLVPNTVGAIHSTKISGPWFENLWDLDRSRFIPLSNRENGGCSDACVRVCRRRFWCSKWYCERWWRHCQRKRIIPRIKR